MEINIFHLYYDLLNVYGDRGNILILKKVLAECGIKCNIRLISVNESFDHKDCDILFMGGGQDHEQVTVGSDLLKKKKSALRTYIENGGCGLYVCGAFQLLGRRYIAADGSKIGGAGIFDIYTEKGDSRFIGNIVLESGVFKARLVGFENHSGRTYINGYTPLGRVIYGHGNNGSDGTEGLVFKNTICTYMHGCCLSKNPEIARFLIANALKKKYRRPLSINFDETLFRKAKDDILLKL